MKKLQLLFCAVALIMTSCTLSNEEKAEKLIQESLKGTLYHPESYKSISTQVDSAFINFENLAKVGELCEELGDLLDKESEYQREYRSAESSKSIYAPNGWYYNEHSRVKYNQYKQECEEYKTKLEKIAPKIATAISELREVSQNLYSDKFTGWIVSHRFTSKNGANTMTIPGDMIFVCDTEFTCCGNGMDSDTFEKLFKFIKKISEAESDQELKEEIKESKYSLF